MQIAEDIKTKLISVFEEAKKFNNKALMRSAYIALEELDTTHTLLQTYIYDLDIFKHVNNMSHTQTEEIDIELYDEENNTFLVFLKEIKNSYQDNFINISEIFSNYDEVYKIINQKVFIDLIFPTIENYFKATTPFVFLYSIEMVYKNIANLGTYIESVLNNFDAKTILDELSQKYSGISIDNERFFFDEIFGKIVHGNQTAAKYIFKNNILAFSKDYEYILDVLLSLIDFFHRRSKIIYVEEDILDMYVFYGERFGRLLEVINDDITDKIKTISYIQKVTTRVKKYFKENFYILSNFIKTEDLLIDRAFISQINQCKKRILQMIGQMIFYRLESDELLIFFVKEQIQKAKQTRGDVYTKFITEIYNITYEALKKKILSIKYGEAQKTNLKQFIMRIFDSVKLTNAHATICKYKYLEDLVVLITVDKINLKEVYDSLRLKILKEDLRAAIKCRNEKDKIVL